VRARATHRVPAADLALHEMDMADFDAGAEAWDLALCMGSSGAYSGYRSALRALHALVRPDGHILHRCLARRLPAPWPRDVGLRPLPLPPAIVVAIIVCYGRDDAAKGPGLELVSVAIVRLDPLAAPVATAPC